MRAILVFLKTQKWVCKSDNGDDLINNTSTAVITKLKHSRVLVGTIPYSRTVWRGIKFCALAIWFEFVNIKSANINYFNFTTHAHTTHSDGVIITANKR